MAIVAVLPSPVGTSSACTGVPRRKRSSSASCQGNGRAPSGKPRALRSHLLFRPSSTSWWSFGLIMPLTPVSSGPGGAPKCAENRGYRFSAPLRTNPERPFLCSSRSESLSVPSLDVSHPLHRAPRGGPIRRAEYARQINVQACSRSRQSPCPRQHDFGLPQPRRNGKHIGQPVQGHFDLPAVRFQTAGRNLEPFRELVFFRCTNQVTHHPSLRDACISAGNRRTKKHAWSVRSGVWIRSSLCRVDFASSCFRLLLPAVVGWRQRVSAFVLSASSSPTRSIHWERLGM